MKFTDIILVLSVSAVASALVTTPNAETRSHQLSKRSPGKDWEKAVGRESNDDDASEPGPSNSNIAENELDDAIRQRKKVCDKYHKYKSEFKQDIADLKLENQGLSFQAFDSDYYGRDSVELLKLRRKKLVQLKERCKEAKQVKREARKEFEKQSGTGWKGKLEQFKSILTNH
ncbi:hypothetical protein O5D80_002542 [Batrachochytrium dendrobatidis]|nr:hypothetical protein O5D80_002542 [Batrachochytrium dendrobatidis]